VELVKSGGPAPRRRKLEIWLVVGPARIKIL